MDELSGRAEKTLVNIGEPEACRRWDEPRFPFVTTKGLHQRKEAMIPQL